MSAKTWVPTHQHVKRRSEYRLLGVGFVQIEPGFVINDFDVVNIRLGPNNVYYVTKHVFGVTRVLIEDFAWEFIGVGTAQVSDGRLIRHGENVVVYLGLNGRLWVRPFDQFMDGRFVDLNKPDPLEALNLFREFVTRHAKQWELGAGDHHHPIWGFVAEALGESAEDVRSGHKWQYLNATNRKTLKELFYEHVKKGDL